jgi:hypothetical protein
MANLFQGYQLEGAYTVTWDAELSATGINYLCLRAGDQMENRILVHIE